MLMRVCCFCNIKSLKAATETIICNNRTVAYFFMNQILLGSKACRRQNMVVGFVKKIEQIFFPFPKKAMNPKNSNDQQAFHHSPSVSPSTVTSRLGAGFLVPRDQSH